jgi:hypothetical protein
MNREMVQRQILDYADALLSDMKEIGSLTIVGQPPESPSVVVRIDRPKQKGNSHPIGVWRMIKVRLAMWLLSEEIIRTKTK